ncbi:hypothetical protein N568_0108560 [Lactococcus garvieae TRF1]|nr:hypothetical protein N568_0108560 [Lactococcus garvieae TRF1]
MGGGNHLIIRNNALRNVSWNAQEGVLTSWYGQLEPAVQAMVQPVANSFTTGEVVDASVTLSGGARWLPNNLEGAVAADLTQVVPGGTARAFALSLADVTRLSGPGLGFPNHAQRGSVALGWWWLRTPAPGTHAWCVGADGGSSGGWTRTFSTINGGVRPALIINQAN